MIGGAAAATSRDATRTCRSVTYPERPLRIPFTVHRKLRSWGWFTTLAHTTAHHAQGRRPRPSGVMGEQWRHRAIQSRTSAVSEPAACGRKQSRPMRRDTAIPRCRVPSTDRRYSCNGAGCLRCLLVVQCPTKAASFFSALGGLHLDGLTPRFVAALMHQLPLRALLFASRRRRGKGPSSGGVAEGRENGNGGPMSRSRSLCSLFFRLLVADRLHGLADKDLVFGSFAGGYRPCRRVLALNRDSPADPPLSFLQAHPNGRT
ncbi:hypothetical protein B0J18DRAFT_45501 [Chaetomium sp. MPI-SDFR-AT-0129]|nr:hypothetical protein B0J18DRAFT_45501 [Chaetomium sp. MPI-SDFR-AT-0129]